MRMRLWLGGVLGMALLGSASAQVLPVSAPLDTHLVSVTPEKRVMSTRYHWVYAGRPGTAFCVAFATSNRTALSSNGALPGRADTASDWFPCSTFNAAGQGEVSVSVYEAKGLLFGTLWLTQDRFHTDVYRLAQDVAP